MATLNECNSLLNGLQMQNDSLQNEYWRRQQEFAMNRMQNAFQSQPIAPIPNPSPEPNQVLLLIEE